ETVEHQIFVAKSSSFAASAQWLEHWSCKPGVVSSILTGAYALQFYGNHHLNNCALFQPLRLVGGKSALLWNHINSGTPDFRGLKLQHSGFIAQWLEHWSSKPGVVSSILIGACPLRCSFTA